MKYNDFTPLKSKKRRNTFITIFAKQFVQDIDFFQTQNKPIFPYVESRLANLTAYI